MISYTRAMIVSLSVCSIAAWAGCKSDDGNGGKVHPDLSVGGDNSDGSVLINQDFGTLDPGCANVTAQAKLNKVDLVFMLDRSGSMGDGINGDPKLKWIPVTQALEAFFVDPKSKGLRASLQFFSLPVTDICDSSGYYFPAVKLEPLPAMNTDFSDAINGISPAGATPTLPAITGAVDYATDNQKTTTADRTAIVLVTDGEPAGCDSSVKNVSTECATAFMTSKIPTYVIGVGDDATGVDDIAMGGGTTKATIISVGDPTQTSADFQTALDGIRGTSLSCNFDIPPPSSGTIDFSKVNVQYTPTTGTASPLPQSPDCTFASGWRFDNAANPTQIVLCPGICNAVRNEDASKIEIVFGCATIIY